MSLNAINFNLLKIFTGTVSQNDYLVYRRTDEGKDYKISISTLLGGGSSGIDDYDPATTYTVDDLAVFNLKIWKWINVSDGNSTPSEGADWTEVSKSEAAGIPAYAAGVYDGANVAVTYGGFIQTLKSSVTRPYTAPVSFDSTKWDQFPSTASLYAIFGDPANLDTTDKSDLVNAINELKGLIDLINTTLTSDDVNYDTLQEIVDFVKTIDTSGELVAVIDAAVGSTIWRELQFENDGTYSAATGEEVQNLVQSDISGQSGDSTFIGFKWALTSSGRTSSGTAKLFSIITDSSEKFSLNAAGDLYANGLEFVDSVFSNAASGALLKGTGASSTNPTLVPYKTDLNTGVGGDGSDTLYLITGGVKAVEISSGQKAYFKDQVFVAGATTSPATSFNIILPSNGKVGSEFSSQTFFQVGNSFVIQANSNIQLTFNDNLFLNSLSDGGGDKVCTLGNANTAPSSNPTGGFIWWSDSGSGKARTPSGNIVTYIPNSPQEYDIISNLTTRRSGDADSGTLAELWDLVGTMLEDWKTLGYFKETP